jgi:hypothetical protein
MMTLLPLLMLLLTGCAAFADGPLLLNRPLLQSDMDGGGHTISNVVIEGYLPTQYPALETDMDGGGHTISNVVIEGYLPTQYPALETDMDGGGHMISNVVIEGYIQDNSPTAIISNLNARNIMGPGYSFAYGFQLPRAGSNDFLFYRFAPPHILHVHPYNGAGNYALFTTTNFILGVAADTNSTSVTPQYYIQFRSGALRYSEGGLPSIFNYSYGRVAIVTNVDPTTITPPVSWHGVELQDVGATQRIFRAFGSSTGDWVRIY